MRLRGSLLNVSDRYVPDPRHHYIRYRAWYIGARWLGRGHDDPDLRRARALRTDAVSGGYAPRHEPLLIPPGKGLHEEEVLQNPQVYRPGFWVFRWEWSGGEYRVATNDLIVEILAPPSPSPATPTPYDALRYLHPTSSPTPIALPPQPTESWRPPGSPLAPLVSPPPVTATAPPSSPPPPPETVPPSTPPPETLLPPLITPTPTGETELLLPLDFDFTPLPSP